MTCDIPKYSYFSNYCPLPEADSLGKVDVVHSAIESPPPEKVVISEDEFLAGVKEQTNDRDLIAFIRSHEASMYSSSRRNIVLGRYSSYDISPKTAIFLTKEFNITITSSFLVDLIIKYDCIELIDPFLKSEGGSWFDLDYEGFYLLTDLYASSKEKALQLFNRHKDFFSKPLKEHLYTSSLRWAKVDFFRDLYRAGMPAEWFNQEIPDWRILFADHGYGTLLYKFIREGEIAFAQEIAKALPEGGVNLDAPNAPYKAESCFVETPKVNVSLFKPNEVIVGQNGCYATIITKNEGAYSFPGQDAYELSQRIYKATHLNPVTVYHRSEHASIHLGEDLGMWGFGPDSRRVRGNFVSFLAQAAVVGGPCLVRFDSVKGIDSSSELQMTFYMTDRQLTNMHQRVKDIQEKCLSGKRVYRLFGGNCVDFTQEVVAAASGLDIDYRDGFLTDQYASSSVGVANTYSVISSSSPTLLIPAGESYSLLDRVDQVGREVVVPAALGLGSYLVVKTAVKAARFVGGLLLSIGEKCAGRKKRLPIDSIAHSS